MTPARKRMVTGIWCLGFSTLIFTALVANVYWHGSVSNIQKVDAIIVLGAAQWNEKPSPIFQARLDHTRELYDAGYAHFIIITGGKAPHHTLSDSSIGKEYLMQYGISADRIFTEELSRTTLQNLIFAQEIMEAPTFQSALLVSHDFHMMRTKEIS